MAHLQSSLSEDCLSKAGDKTKERQRIKLKKGKGKTTKNGVKLKKDRGKTKER